MAKTYSLQFDGAKQLSKNFAVREFACPDGTDKILIDDALVLDLQAIRDYFGQPVDIGSGYRTVPYNKLIGGDPASSHLYGQAADIDVGRFANAINARKVAMFAEAVGITRIGLYMYSDGRSWIHIGSLSEKLFWFDSNPGIRTNPKTFLPTLRRQYGLWTNMFEVKAAQEILAAKGYYKDKIDGKFGPNMKKAVLAFQRDTKISVDGIIGPDTWRHLFRK